MPLSWTLETADGVVRVHTAPPTSLIHEVATVRQPATGVKEMPPFTDISNSTVPVGATGLAEPGVVTVKPAFVVMISPVTDVFTTAVTPVSVEARFTVCVTGNEVEVAKLVSPE